MGIARSTRDPPVPWPGRVGGCIPVDRDRSVDDFTSQVVCTAVYYAYYASFRSRWIWWSKEGETAKTNGSGWDGQEINNNNQPQPKEIPK